jgi:hypothetical protein
MSIHEKINKFDSPPKSVCKQKVLEIKSIVLRPEKLDMIQRSLHCP